MISGNLFLLSKKSRESYQLNDFISFAENVVKTHMAQDLGLISRRGVERLIRGDVDPDRLIQEAQHVDKMSAMDVYKK